MSAGVPRRIFFSAAMGFVDVRLVVLNHPVIHILYYDWSCRENYLGFWARDPVVLSTVKDYFQFPIFPAETLFWPYNGEVKRPHFRWNIYRVRIGRQLLCSRVCSYWAIYAHVLFSVYQVWCKANLSAVVIFAAWLCTLNLLVGVLMQCCDVIAVVFLASLGNAIRAPNVVCLGTYCYEKRVEFIISVGRCSLALNRLIIACK